MYRYPHNERLQVPLDSLQSHLRPPISFPVQSAFPNPFAADMAFYYLPTIRNRSAHNSEGKSYFLMENQKYGKDAAALVLNQYGKVILDECKDGFDQDTIDRMKSAVQKFNEQEKQKGAIKERLSVWQKYFINGEYLRSAEMAEEQNYNMIDGRINNLLPKKENPEVPKKRKSVLLRLYKHRCEVAKKQGKPMPRRYQGMEMERNRK